MIAAIDPDPRTNGEGIARLRKAGINVSTGELEAEARAAMAGFFTRRALGRPFVTLKLATSLDGQIALADGSSQWITGVPARAHAHLERAQHEAILIGRGTLEADAPRLDVRLAGLESRSPRRVLMSRSGGHAPEGWLEVCAPEDIAALPGDHLLVEGGAETAAAFLAADLVDRLLLYRRADPDRHGQGRGRRHRPGRSRRSPWSLAPVRNPHARRRHARGLRTRTGGIEPIRLKYPFALSLSKGCPFLFRKRTGLRQAQPERI
ncbi:MAG: dihydrofolate reductase family protein [Lacunisphaera sp.]